MIEAEWVMCARGTSVDRDSGALTIFSIVDGFAAFGFPLAIQQISLIAVLKRQGTDSAKSTGALRITQNNVELFSGPIEVDFHENKRSHLLLGLNGLVIPDVGEITFSLVFESREIGRCVVDARGPNAMISGLLPPPPPSFVPPWTNRNVARSLEKKRASKKTAKGRIKKRRKGK